MEKVCVLSFWVFYVRFHGGGGGGEGGKMTDRHIFFLDMLGQTKNLFYQA